jgi:hypothetical protein
LGSWANADEFDYSGEQLMGHRQGKSVCMDHMLPSGMANLKRYGDPVEQKPKVQPRPKLSAFDKVCTADRSYEKLCILSEELDQQLDSKQISWDDYIYARKQLDKKLERAWGAVCRNRGWEGQEELLALEQYPSQPLDFTLELEAKKPRQYDYSILSSTSVFSSLKDDNFFKQCACLVLTGYKAVSNILNNTKEILKEGLV